MLSNLEMLDIVFYGAVAVAALYWIGTFLDNMWDARDDYYVDDEEDDDSAY